MDTTSTLPPLPELSLRQGRWSTRFNSSEQGTSLMNYRLRIAPGLGSVPDHNGVPPRVARLYRSAAISNFLVTVPVFVSYHRYVGGFFSEKSNYPFLVHIWSGMAFLWGVMFWEIAKDPIRKQALVKYSYLEKAVTSASVVAAVALHDKQKSVKLPLRMLAGVTLTDIVWLPLFVQAHGKLRALRRCQDA